jgi:hypothetical protein
MSRRLIRERTRRTHTMDEAYKRMQARGRRCKSFAVGTSAGERSVCRVGPGICSFDKACATDLEAREAEPREEGRDGCLATDWLLQGAVPCEVGLLPRANINNLREIALCLQQNCSSVGVSSVRTGC